MMVKNIKRILLIVFSFVILENIISIFYPISSMELDKAKQICNEFNLIEVKSGGDSEYVTREEFLTAVLKTIGLNHYITYTYSLCDRSSIPTEDFVDTDKYPIGDEFLVICYIAQDLDLLQTPGKTNEFRGKEYIEYQEAITLLQACLSDINSDRGIFHKYSYDFIKMFVKAHFNGITYPFDSSYWSATNTKLTRKDVYVLLSRLSHKKRYKYLLDTGNILTCVQIDENRELTYKEFLEK